MAEVRVIDAEKSHCVAVALQIRHRDRDEVAACDCFVLYAEPDDHLKGCILEMGIAFSLGRPIVIIWAGPIEALAAKIGTIVYHQSVTVVTTTEQAVAILRNGEKTGPRLMDAEDFVALARQVLDRHAHPDSRGRNYEDEDVSIVENHLGLGLMIVRMAKDVDESGMRRPNATTIVDEAGTVIRHHAEHALLVDHMILRAR